MRDQIDAAVLKALRRARSPQSAPDLSKAAGVSVMQGVYALKRLCDRGQAYAHTVLKDTPGRVRTTVVMYQADTPKKPQEFPAWLQPSIAPPASSRRIYLVKHR